MASVLDTSKIGRDAGRNTVLLTSVYHFVFVQRYTQSSALHSQPCMRGTLESHLII
jgi:hypothetical protein